MVQTGVVGVVGDERSIEPHVQYLFGHDFAGAAQGETEDVGVVPEARAAGGLGVVAQGGADAGNLVGSDADAGAGPAKEDAFVGCAGCDGFGDGAAGSSSWPRRRSSAMTASVTWVRSSEPMAIFIACSLAYSGERGMDWELRMEEGRRIHRFRRFKRGRATGVGSTGVVEFFKVG